MKGVSYESFVDHVDILVKSGILKIGETFGYKKTFRDVLVENQLIFQKDKCFYVKSILNGETYCFTSGQFQNHLSSCGISAFDYLRKCGVKTKLGYVVNPKWHGKESKKFFSRIPSGDKLYFALRSVLTSVSSDYRKLMLFYGCTEDEAKIVSSEKHERYSKTHTGERNSSYGKRGINANCFSSFRLTRDPNSYYSEFIKEKRRKAIVRWASDKNIDETNFEDLKFRYYSEMFKAIHRKKGEEFRKENNLKTTEEGIYMFNRNKSVKNFNAKSLSEYCISLIKQIGTEEQEIEAVRYLLDEDYYSLLGLVYFIKGMSGFKKGRVPYTSQKFGKFNLRSKLEKGVLWILDRLDICENIKYENVRIPYFNHDKKHSYVIDFDILLKTGRRILIEVKPYCQAILPEGIILLKKKAAEEYSEKNGCVYLFVTEKDLKYELLRKKLQSV